MIEIVFGMALDGAKWSKELVSIGKMTCGPLGMLKFLETRLGLGGVEISLAERIGAYLEKTRAVYADDVKAWGAESFRKDSWTTAKRLLSLRDELVLAGWDGKRGGSDRLDLLAKVEATGTPTPAGLGDRLKLAVETCTKESLSEVKISVADDMAKYPHYWRVLFEKLGIESRWKAPQLPAPEVGDRPLVDEVVAANEIQLAGLFVKDLKDRLDGKKKVAIVAEGETGVLDGFLHREGLPSIGRGQGSAERAAMQILPLWVEYMWRPFSPVTLLAILTSEVSPVPHGRNVDDRFHPITPRLVQAVREAPGICGEPWQKAWDEIGEGCADLREALEAQQYDPEGTGIPYEEFARRIGWLVSRLSKKVSADYMYLDVKAKEVLKVTIRNAGLLKKLAQALDKIDCTSVRRLMESIVADGMKRSDARQEVAPWMVLKHPGQITTDVDCLLWWNFCDNGKGTGTYWTSEERSALGSSVQFDTENAYARESDAWYNALARSKSELRLYVPMTLSGNECGTHPFRADLTHLKYIDEDKKIVIREDDAICPVICEEGQDGPDSLTMLVAPNSEVKPKRVSASQLSTMLSCPYEWYLKYHLGLKQPDVLDLPEDSTMVGLLAHKVVETLISVDRAKDASTAKRLAGERFDELVPQMAAPLDAPDRRIVREHNRRLLQESVETLWQEIEKRGLKFVAAEKVLDKAGAFQGVDFVGRADLLLEDSDGKPYVIDFKWSSGKRYIEAAENGRSIQLATYSWAIGDPDDWRAQSAYYLFPRKLFYPNPQDNKEVFGKVIADYERTLREMRCGELHRGYAKGETRLGLEPACVFCSFGALCGKGKERA